ncbi:peptidylprolyl isomerase [Cohnella laeviribosi]|uniref:peptidylprolyl isomerase n=1 Tax=Cohnella laeviribosi TaxID=380174 RepID=UPI00037061DD|nr:peptidylprolyl isomerase [Cohnella laeviribosi]
MLHRKGRLLGRLIAITVAAALLVGLMAACGKKEENQVVAEYEGGQVTNKEFTAYKTFLKIFSVYSSFPSLVDEPSSQEQLLKQFVGIRILSDRASKEIKEQASKDVKEQFEAIKKSLNSNEELKKTMKEGGLTDDLIVQFESEQQIMLKDAESKVTDEEAQKYYNENKDSFNYVTVRHILIGLTDKNGKTRKDEEALKLANEVKAKLEKGGDWTELAKEYSDDGGSASNGGLYEKANPSEWVEEFKKAAQTLPIGQISDPVKTEYGYHVMKVEERGTKTFDEAKTSIKQTIASENIGKFMTDELPGLIKSINLPKPSPSPSPSASPSASPSPSASAPASESPSASPTASASASASASAGK